MHDGGTLRQDQADRRRIVNVTLQTIADRLRGGQTITLTGFGTFSMKERRARSGVNPQTKQSRSPPAGARTGSRPVPC